MERVISKRLVADGIPLRRELRIRLMQRRPKDATAILPVATSFALDGVMKMIEDDGILQQVTDNWMKFLNAIRVIQFRAKKIRTKTLRTKKLDDPPQSPERERECNAHHPPRHQADKQNIDEPTLITPTPPTRDERQQKLLNDVEG